MRRKYFSAPKKGKMLAILGPDGSGKTTISNELTRLVHENVFFCGVETFHFRTFRGSSLGSVMSDGSGVISGGRPYGAQPRSSLGSAIKLLYYLFEYNIGYLKNIRPLIRENKLVIFDRYFLDFALDPSRARIRLPKGIITFLNKFIPQPDLYVFLVGDPMQLAKRKGELTTEETSALIQGYTCAGKKLGLVLDTMSGTPSEMAEKIFIYLTFNAAS